MGQSFRGGFFLVCGEPAERPMQTGGFCTGRPTKTCTHSGEGGRWESQRPNPLWSRGTVSPQCLPHLSRRVTTRQQLLKWGSKWPPLWGQ